MAKKKKKLSRSSKRTAAISAGLLALILVSSILVSALASAVGGSSSSTTFDFSVTAESPIQLSEIMASNTSALVLSDGSMPDWIELVNTGDEDISLDGYVLLWAEDPTEMYKFSDVTLAAGEYLILLADGETGTDSDGIHIPLKVGAGGGSELVLMNSAGAVIDSVTTVSLEDNQVYCRNGSDWELSIEPTPGEANSIVTEEDEVIVLTSIEETDSLDGVTVTEVMSHNSSYWPDEDGNYDDYVELTNFSDEDVSLEGWYLSDDTDNIVRWQFPDVTIAAGESIVIYCSGLDRTDDADYLHTNFKLGSDGAYVILTRSDGTTASLVEVPELASDQVYSLVDGTWTDDFSPTPGLTNTVESAAEAVEVIRSTNTENVIINEICAAASSSDADWIELYNAGTTTVDLSGYGLSDNSARPRKWQFPEGTTIEPGEYLGVFCSGYDTVEDGYCHTNFKLSAEGGYTISLSRSDGTIIDHVYVSQQYEDVTYGRVDGEDGFYFFTDSTPLAENDGVAYLGKASTPTYSTRGGLYETGDVITVELSAPEGAQIYYTLDFTDPDESSTLYTEPITISSTTILRTRVYQDGYLVSFMDTQSYLYDVNNGDGVYVVSLVSDPDNLTSEETGIMIKGSNASSTYPYTGANYWQDWEREAHVEIYGGDGEQVLSSECGIKLHGQYSRAEDQQAFKVLAKTEYGNNRFQCALFSNRDYTEYQSFLLRSSGQDTDKTRMRDSVLTSLAADTSVMYQETEICVLYLDGSYWGQYNIRERICVESICQFEDWEGDEDNIDLVKANSNTKQGSNETFANLISWCKETDPTADTFYSTLDEIIDIQNYMEYMAIEIFVGNGDTLNVKRYRNSNADGKWRWVLYDLDWAFIVDTNSINRWLTPGGMGTNLYTDNTLFITCMKNEQFKDEFLTYMGEQMATTLTTEHVLELMEARYEILKPLLEDQFERWGQTAQDYLEELEFMIEYAEERPAKLLTYFSTTEYLSLTTEEMYYYFGDALEVIENYSSS